SDTGCLEIQGASLGNKVSAGTVQSVIGVTFIYE
ncbi:hypothetical protein, partial [Shigella sonnei]